LLPLARSAATPRRRIDRLLAGEVARVADGATGAHRIGRGRRERRTPRWPRAARAARTARAASGAHRIGRGRRERRTPVRGDAPARAGRCERWKSGALAWSARQASSEPTGMSASPA
jgi:hypothetical protein